MLLGRCPDIAKLEAALVDNNRRVAKHVGKCMACQGVLALIVGRTADVETEECAPAELLFAKRDIAPLSASDQQLLDNHIEHCEPCRIVDKGDKSDKGDGG